MRGLSDPTLNTENVLIVIDPEQTTRQYDRFVTACISRNSVIKMSYSCYLMTQRLQGASL